MEQLLLDTFNNDKFIIIENFSSDLKFTEVFRFGKMICVPNNETNIKLLCTFYKTSTEPTYFGFLKFHSMYETKYGLTPEMISDLISHYYYTKNEEQLTKYYLMGMEKGMTDMAKYHAGLYYKNVDRDEANKIFSQLATSKPPYRAAVAELTEYYEKCGDMENAAKYHKISNYSINSWHFLFGYYSVMGDVQQMMECANKIASSDKFTLGELETLAGYYEARENEPKMMECYQKIVELGGEVCGEVYFDLAKLNLAKPECKKYLKLACDKNHPEACYRYSTFVTNEQKILYLQKAADLGYEKAVRELASVGKLKRKADKYDDVEACYRYSGYCEKDQQIAYLEKAIGLGHVGAMLNFAKAAEDVKDYVMMERYYVMAMGKGDFTGWGALVSYYENNGYYYRLLEMYLRHVNSGKISTKELIRVVGKYLESNYGLEEDDDILELVISTDFGGVEMPLFVKMIKRLAGKQLDLARLHLEHEPGSEKFKELEKRFEEVKQNFMSFMENNKTT